jgi:hypothetical protein
MPVNRNAVRDPLERSPSEHDANRPTAGSGPGTHFRPLVGHHRFRGAAVIQLPTGASTGG